VNINNSSDVKLRLSEISRRSAELSAISSKLQEMVIQLHQLRRLNGRVEFLEHRDSGGSRKRDYHTYRLIGSRRDRT
jgi:hypothetical protein